MGSKEGPTMRLTRSVVVNPVLALGLVLSACSPRADRTGGPSSAGRKQTALTGDLLVLGTAQSVTAVASGTGHRLFSGAGVPALADWTELFTADRADGRTVLRAIGTRTGKVLARSSLPGDLAIGVVSSDAERVALMAPLPP